jgi:M-phase inducer tyrosine phosphatase
MHRSPAFALSPVSANNSVPKQNGLTRPHWCSPTAGAAGPSLQGKADKSPGWPKSKISYNSPAGAAGAVSPAIPQKQFVRSPGVPGFDDSPSKDIPFLPTLPLSGAVPRITCETLAEILDGEYDDHFDDLFIIDCRYAYEHEGGCIKGATNVNSPKILTESFFEEITPNALLVFHCEFSHNRGPQLAAIFREIDRNKNRNCYPHLFYPNVFVLDGGYRQFYSLYPDKCDGGYTPMLDDVHRLNGDLTKATSQFRKNLEKMENRRDCASQRPKNNFLMSPVAMGSASSPIVSRALNFLASPVQPRRI